MNVTLVVGPEIEPTPDVVESPATDGELLDQAARGDQPAWETLIRRHAGLVNGVAARYGLQEWDRADVFQGVWEELWERREVRRREALPAWLVRTTGQRSWQVLCERQPAPESPVPSSQPTPAAAWQPAERIMLEGQWATLARSMEQLEPHCRHLVHALFFDPEHPSDAEVAQRTSESGEALRCRSTACLQHLRTLLARNATPSPRS
ncbi:MAG: hypothetical protein QOF51_2639 [Chloroflexota bacterium]|nr:hypothetical protein [Chloroflexota bacterium]